MLSNDFLQKDSQLSTLMWFQTHRRQRQEEQSRRRYHETLSEKQTNSKNGLEMWLKG
jgi:hypothetical protein